MEFLRGPTLACCSPIPNDRTFAPGQGVLERLEEVEDTPPNDHIVVQPDEEADLRTRVRLRPQRLQVKPPPPPCTPSKAQQLKTSHDGGCGGGVGGWGEMEWGRGVRWSGGGG